MFQPGARSLLKLSTERTEQRCHHGHRTARMLEQAGVTPIQILQFGVSGAKLGLEVFVDRICSGTAAGGCRSVDQVRQLAEPKTKRLLVGNAVLQFIEIIPGDGRHGSLELSGERTQQLEMLSSFGIPG